MSQQDKRQLGKILLEQKALSLRDLDTALEQQRRQGGGPLASQLAEQGIVREAQALKALSEQHGVPGIDLNQVCIALDDLDLLPREIAERHKILPVLVRDDRIFVAMANPGDKKVIDELEFVTGKRVFPYVALSTALERVLGAAYDMKVRGERFYVGPTCPPETLERMGVQAPVEARPSSPPIPSAQADSRPPVVMGDAMGRAAEADELSDDDFGNLSAEISAVTDLSLMGTGLDDLGPATQRKTILVVDDEADIRRMLKRLLSEKGYRVLEADRGLAALRLVKEHTPDLIVLDAMLPEVHGFDIARRIKGSQKYGHIPIVMVSAVYRGWRYAEDIKTSYGVSAYIEKPFRIADMLSAVEKAFTATESLDDDAGEEEAAVSADAERALSEGIAAYHAGDVEKAIAHLKRGVGIDPLAYRLHFHLGLLLGKRGLIYEAIQALETALDINSRHFPALKNLAVLYQKAGFRNKAIETWERALAIAPDDPTKQSIKEHLVGLL